MHAILLPASLILSNEMSNIILNIQITPLLRCELNVFDYRLVTTSGGIEDKEHPRTENSDLLAVEEM